MERMIAEIAHINHKEGWAGLLVRWEGNERPMWTLRVPLDFVPEEARTGQVIEESGVCGAFELRGFPLDRPEDLEADQKLIDKLADADKG